MHELSIAVNLIEVAEREAERQNAVRVNAVHLRLGPLAGVVKEALLSAYGLACEGTLLENSSLLIDDVPIVAYCPRCQAECSVASPQWFCCSACGTPVSRVLRGRELEVFALEIEQ
jgi:hydrogenase nickel incorporation protein HypA/HybF